MLCWLGSALRRPAKTPQPNPTHVPSHQLELWGNAPHPVPRLYHQLSAEERNHIIRHLAELILKVVTTDPSPAGTTSLAKESDES